jgi:hypothetical protein
MTANTAHTSCPAPSKQNHLPREKYNFLMAIGTPSATQLLSQIPLGQLLYSPALAFADEKQDISEWQYLCPDPKKEYLQDKGMSAIFSFPFLSIIFTN